MTHLADIERKIAFGCEDCKHYLDDCKCKAFDIIPEKFWDDASAHNSVEAGQKGKFIFEAAREQMTIRSYEPVDESSL